MCMTKPHRGLFIAFEGLDGSGKSTQLRLLAERVKQLGREVVCTIEPGGTDIGNQIRSVVLDHRNVGLDRHTELLLYFAARAQNVAQVIRPALDLGQVVLTDRYTHSTLAYQGAGRSLGEDVVRQVHAFATDNLWPDLTILVDVPAREALDRRRQVDLPDRLEREALDFHERVRSEYLRMAGEQKERIAVVDGNRDIPSIAADIWATVEPLLLSANC